MLRPAKSMVSVVSVGFTELKTLSHQDLTRLARKFPEVWQHFRAIVKRPAHGFSISGSSSISHFGDGASEAIQEEDGEKVDEAAGKIVLRWLVLASRVLREEYACDKSNRLVNLLVQFSRRVCLDSTEREVEGNDDEEDQMELSSSASDSDVRVEGEDKQVRIRDKVFEEMDSKDTTPFTRSFRQEQSFRLQHVKNRTRMHDDKKANLSSVSHLDERMQCLELQNSELRQQVASIQSSTDHIVFMIARQVRQPIGVIAKMLMPV